MAKSKTAKPVPPPARDTDAPLTRAERLALIARGEADPTDADLCTEGRAERLDTIARGEPDPALHGEPPSTPHHPEASESTTG